MEPMFLGGIFTHQEVERRRLAGLPVGVLDEDWGWVGESSEVFLRRGRFCKVFAWDSLVMVVRGIARPADGTLDLERVAEELRCQYLEQGRLDLESLEGSFTLTLLDGHTERALLYRSLVGSTTTYYHASPRGLLFGNNLAELVEVLTPRPRENANAMPAFFLFRLVPGRDTLFEGVHRLLPGEEVCWERESWTRRQRQTLRQLTETPAHDPVERLQEVLSVVVADVRSVHARTTNLLSGGADSSLLQAILNGQVEELLPTSFSISVDHPRTWADTDEAISASRHLGTRHLLVPAERAYDDYLIETVAATGEPPNHVQSAYFGDLGGHIVRHGISGCLSAVGADSLLGLDSARQVYNAQRIGRRVPLRLLRRAGHFLARALNRPRWAEAFWLADHLEEEESFLHPVNQTAAFTDWQEAVDVFGKVAVRRALGARRGWLDDLEVPPDPLERMHAACFFGMAIHTAGLWTSLLERGGVELHCPFLDSRMLRFANGMSANDRYQPQRPKDLVRRALLAHLPREMVYRAKMGFGQPIFEWLAPGGVLHPLVRRIARPDFLDARTLARIQQAPSWMLYNLLCYDLWRKLFIERASPDELQERTSSPVRQPSRIASCTL
jgi:asparagine synthase (glutamine-hydrolysing)